MTITHANLGDEMFISKPMALMTADLNGPWVIPALPGKDGQPLVRQPMPRHKHLMQALWRFNVSLLGLQEHHLQCPPRHVSMDIVTEKLQNLFHNRWLVLANPSFSERSGVALACRTDLWTMVSSSSPLRGQGRTLGTIL